MVLTRVVLPTPGPPVMTSARLVSRDDVSDYCAKYVTKEGAWWGVKLIGQRHPSFKDFKLVIE
jgi:hypothetical protein